MNERQLLIAGSLNMFVAVAAGAFGAHGLRRVVTPEMLSVWHTAVMYHLIHGLGLLLIAALMPRLGEAALSTAGTLMFVGIVLFSGSLYLLALTSFKLIGIITPIGGVAFLVSWAWIAMAAWRAAPR